jgi:hypothetical protein
MAAAAAPSRLATARKGPLSFRLTLLYWVKAPMLSQSSGWPPGVGRADGDGADQAASDLTVGRALSTPPLGIGADRRVIAQPGQHDQVQGLVELAVPGAVQPHPHRLAAGRGDGSGAAQHGEGGIAWAAARMGPGAQHDRGHDRAHPAAAEQVGCQVRTKALMARVWSATSVFRRWMRRAKVRRLAAVAAVSTSQVACCRSRPQVATSRAVVRLRSRPRRGSEAATMRAWSCRWASVAAWTAERRAGPAALTRRHGDQPLSAGRGGRAPWPRGPPWSHPGGRTWRRGGGRPAWAGPAPPPARHEPAGTGSGRRRSHRCSRSPTPADRRVGRRALSNASGSAMDEADWRGAAGEGGCPWGTPTASDPDLSRRRSGRSRSSRLPA